MSDDNPSACASYVERSFNDGYILYPFRVLKYNEKPSGNADLRENQHFSLALLITLSVTFTTRH
jgi:hypothetical protein